MNTGVSRRVFVGSVAAGLPAAAGAALIAQTSPPAHDHAAASRDAVFDHLLSQLAAVHNRASRNTPTSEDGRAAAAILRTMKVSAAQRSLDTEVKRGMADIVRRRGRDAALYAQPDAAALRNELKRLGVDPASIRFGSLGPPTDAVRRGALDGLSRNGITSRFEDIAKHWQRLSEDLDRRGGPGSIVRIHNGDSYECRWMNNQLSYLEIEVALSCGAAAFFPPLASICGALSITLGIELMLFRYWC